VRHLESRNLGCFARQVDDQTKRAFNEHNGPFISDLMSCDYRVTVDVDCQHIPVAMNVPVLSFLYDGAISCIENRLSAPSNDIIDIQAEVPFDALYA